MTISYRTCLPLCLLGTSAMSVDGRASGFEARAQANAAARSWALVARTSSSGCDDDRRDAATTATTGSTGHVEIGDFFIGGSFFADDIILERKTIQSVSLTSSRPDEALSAAGTLTVSS